jgi:stage V sporulation protein AC
MDVNKVNAEKYKLMVETKEPKSKLGKDCLMAFLFGGAICVLGQIVNDIAKAGGMDKTMASATSSAVLITLAAILTACNVFDSIGKVAGAGTLVPITGFANSVVASAMEFKTEGYVFGTSVKFFAIAGPVIVFGTIFSALYGIILLILKLTGVAV